MKQETLNLICDRAKNKKNGIYVLDCIKYTVTNGRLGFLIDFEELFEFSHGFLVSLGKVDKSKARLKLRKLMSKL